MTINLDNARSRKDYRWMLDMLFLMNSFPYFVSGRERSQQPIMREKIISEGPQMIDFVALIEDWSQ